MRTITLATLAALLLTAGCGDDKDDSGSGGTTQTDADGDGFTALLDCDDNDANVNPDAEEVPYDGVDNDCDDETLDDDLDQDGHDSDATGGGDCDDDDPMVNPDANEVCNGVDDDCNGAVDDNAGQSWYQDADGDSWGDPDNIATGCDGESGYVANSRDCDDGDASIHPGADETCDGVDQDCDDVVDDNPVDGTSWYADDDGDAYGDPNDSSVACEQPKGMVADNTDCNDADADVSPAADEVCDALDNDCDGFVDENDAVDADSWYMDADGDGFGDPDAAITGCSAPTGTVDDNTDCDDTDATVYPGATEIWYDGVDQDCAGDDDLDADADGDRHEDYGGADCDDADASINSLATETWYDGIDSDCDGLSDFDADSDGYDSDAYAGTDCDDTDATVYPGASEVDPKLDNDCDGEVEEMPVADAIYDVSSSLLHCEALLLDASASYDPDGTALTYEWDVVSVPSGSDVDADSFDDTGSETPTVYPDLAGDYEFMVTVTDQGDTSASTTLSVTIAPRPGNTAPVADAGADETISENGECAADGWGYSGEYTCEDCDSYSYTLDGSNSADADGEPLSYLWTVISGDAAITNDTAVDATAILAGPACEWGSTTTETFEFQLEVTDCYGDTATDTVTITYECTGA